MGKRGKKGQSLVTLDYLLGRTVPSATGCMEWDGTRHRQGYGMVHDPMRHRTNVAHRVLYELLHDTTLTRSQVVRHKCDNPPCINPDHLELGTQVDNMLDAQRRERRTRTSSISVETAGDIKAALRAGKSYTEIASQVDCSIHIVRLIGQGRTWQWVA